MEYKLLGKTGVKVSQLCFGTMTFGKEADRKTSADLYVRCRDAGINFFDCADVYVGGESERILGELIRAHRREVVITTKVFGANSDEINDRGASRRHIKEAVERSLSRLGTDYIDLYFLHNFDENTPIEETLRGLEDIVREGKVLYIGASNFAAWQIMKALGISDRNAWTRFECIQPMYNLVKRQAEVEILPLASAENVGVITYSPLGGGLLTGKYARGTADESSRLSWNKMYQSRYRFDWMKHAAEELPGIAEKHGYSTAALAVAWVAHNPAITAPIIGARNLDQLNQSLDSLAVDMTDELYSEITELSLDPPPATDRAEVKG
jgi:aryl-alcohol dehydrogenase-like predicted oxidoreductase